MSVQEAANVLLNCDLPQFHTLLPMSHGSSPCYSGDSQLTPFNTCSDEDTSTAHNMNTFINAQNNCLSVRQELSNPDFEGREHLSISSSWSDFLQDNTRVSHSDSANTIQDYYEIGSSRERNTDSNIPSSSALTRKRCSRTKTQVPGQPKPSIRKPTCVTNNLPPCRVCAGPASGFHYGVNSCEACKRFFRRALKRKRNFTCKGKKNCIIKGKKTSLCRYCRYERCLALGMSKTAIKSGRYTQQKRVQDNLEVERLLSQEKVFFLPEAEVTSIVRQLKAAHSDIITNANVPLKVLVSSAMKKAEEFSLKMNTFGFQDNLTSEQYDEVFGCTGLDIDGRLNHMEHVARAIDRFIHGYVCFGKGIPGFNNLSINDQANLLKLARVEVWFLGAFRGFMKEYNVFFSPGNECIHRLEMKRLLGNDYTEYAYELSERAKKLNLSEEELIILKTVYLTFSDRCELDDAPKVEALQWKMLRCLLFLLRKNHPEDPAMFHKIMNLTMAVRNLSELSRKAMSNTHFFSAIQRVGNLANFIFI